MSKQRIALRSWLTVYGEGEAERVLVDTRTGSMFSFNATASALLEQLSGGSTAAQLVEMLSGSFEVVEDDAWRDVRTFLGKLNAMGLIDETA